MVSWRRFRGLLWTGCFIVVLSGVVWAQAAPAAQEGFQPQVGQAGKDVVWVPTPYVLVEKMLDMAKVGPQDVVMDLGSGDGRNIIAAAKRGARAIGVEYNPNMVELSRKTAAKEGVSDKATFIEGDMFEADISKATVLALFLLPDNLRRLTPKFLDLKPGTRIVGNTFGIEGWAPDESDTSGGDCGSWCQSLLWIVPAKVAGVWRLPKGELALSQSFQVIAGTLTVGGTSTPIVNGKLRGEQISFSAGGNEYSGRVNGDSISGAVKSASGNSDWTATRVSK
jgi:SAM-dependent methyltransferase